MQPASQRIIASRQDEARGTRWLMIQRQQVITLQGGGGGGGEREGRDVPGTQNPQERCWSQSHALIPQPAQGAPGTWEVWGQRGSGAGHGRAVPAPCACFLEQQQERRECSGDVNADIHGPCQAPRCRGCSQQLTLGWPGGEKGPRRWLGAAAKPCIGRCQPHGLPWQGLLQETPPALTQLLPCTGKRSGRGAREGDGQPRCCGTAPGPAPCTQPMGLGLRRGLNWGKAELHPPPLRWSPTAESPRGGAEPGQWCRAAFPLHLSGMAGIHPAKPWTTAHSSGAGSSSCFPAGSRGWCWRSGGTDASAGPKELALQPAEAEHGAGGIIRALYSWGAKPQSLSLVSTEALAVERTLMSFFPCSKIPL